MILKPGREAEAEAIFKKWGLDFAVIGKTTDTGRMIVRHKGEIEADLPVDKLANSAPLYERPLDARRRRPPGSLPSGVAAARLRSSAR